MQIDEYPYNIQGYISDNFFEANPKIGQYPFIKTKVEEEEEKGGIDYVSKIMWSIYLYLDPRTFIYDKMTYDEKRMLVIRSYNSDFNPEQLKSYITFYEERVLRNEDILYFTRLKRQYEEKVKWDKSFTIIKAVKELKGFMMYSKKAYGVLNMSEQYYNRTKNRYPRKIDGNPEEHNFFTKNKEVLLFEEINHLITKEGVDNASKVMWSFYNVLDPKSFYFDKTTREEREKKTIEKYYNIDFTEYLDIEDFYKKVLLMDEEQVNYSELKKKMDFLIMSEKYDVLKASVDREELLKYKTLVFNDSEGFAQVVIQGKIQPGLLARRIVRE